MYALWVVVIIGIIVLAKNWVGIYYFLLGCSYTMWMTYIWLKSGDEYSKVTRFEVIDETGRVMVKYGVNLQTSLQDKGRTLKVFIKDK